LKQSKKNTIASGLLVSTLMLSTVIPATADTTASAVNDTAQAQTDATQVEPATAAPEQQTGATAPAPSETLVEEAVAAVPAKLSVPAPLRVSKDAFHTVEVSILDDTNNVITTSTDEVALQLNVDTKEPIGDAIVTDKSGKQVYPNSKGEFILAAENGVATFQVSDNVAETLKYRLTLVSNSKITANISGNFSQVTRYSVSSSTFAPQGTLGMGIERKVTYYAQDKYGWAIANAPVYLKINEKTSATAAPIGTAVVNKADGTIEALDKAPTLFYTDKDGKIIVTYTTAVALPRNGGMDTITMQDTDGTTRAKLTSSSSYTYGKFQKYTLSSTTIATSGSLGAGGSKQVKVYSWDSLNNIFPNTTVYLSRNAGAVGTAKVGNVELTEKPQPFTTNAQGELPIDYTSPNIMPSGGTDSIFVQDSATTKTQLKSTYTYSTLRSLLPVPATIAAQGSLRAGEERLIAFNAKDTSGRPMPNTIVYLSFVKASFDGTAYVNGTKLDDTKQQFVTDASGQVIVKYKAPTELPSGGTDKVVAQNKETSPTLTQSASYSFQQVYFRVLGENAATIATTGSLGAGQTKEVTVVSEDSRGIPQGNRTVWLSLTGLLGRTAAASGATASVGSINLTDVPQKFTTGGDGYLKVTYTAPKIMTSGMVDTIKAQDVETSPKVTRPISYTYRSISTITAAQTTFAAKGTLKPGDVRSMTFAIKDASGNSMRNTKVYLSLYSTVANASGSAYVTVVSDDGKTTSNVPFDKGWKEFVTDFYGKIIVNYKAADVLPNNTTETVKIADAPNGTRTKTATYSYNRIP
jgi:hypothetical protein